MNSELSMDHVLIDKLNKILDENLEKEHFGVKELAKEFGLSRSQLHRKVKSITNKAPSRLIREFRLEKAMEMLQKNEATASEIAYRVGFNSPTYFNTCFHNYYGYPPGEVKFRRAKDNLEGQLNIGSPRLSSRIKNIRIFNRRMVWFNSILIVLLSVFGYKLYQNFKDYSFNEIVVFNGHENKSIAILPFKNLSDDVDNQYFADGVSGAIQNNLNKISDLVVIPSSSMEKYRNSDLAVTEIAQEVNVMYLLEGSVQKYSDSIRVITSLVDARDNVQLQSFVFDWEYKNVFEIQSKIAIQVAEELDIRIGPTELESIENIPTKNLEAYNLFLQAKFQASKRTKKAMGNAKVLYENAIKLDSSFCKAYVKYADLWLFGGAIWGSYSEREAWENAKFLLYKAKQLDSTNMRINRALLDGLYMFEWDFERMEKEYKNSSVSSAYEIQTGRYEEALAEANQWIQMDPTSGFAYANKAQALFFLNRKEEAIKFLKSNDDLFDDHIDYLREAAKCYFYLEEYRNSKVLLDKIMINFIDRPPIVLWLNAVYEVMEGNTESANTYLDELQKKYNNEASGSPAWFIALYYCTKKDYENALNWLQKSYDRHEVEMIWLRAEPLLIPLRNDARYLDLYKKVGFPMKPHSF